MILNSTQPIPSEWMCFGFFLRVMEEAINLRGSPLVDSRLEAATAWALSEQIRDFAGTWIFSLPADIQKKWIFVLVEHFLEKESCDLATLEKLILTWGEIKKEISADLRFNPELGLAKERTVIKVRESLINPNRRELLRLDREDRMDLAWCGGR